MDLRGAAPTAICPRCGTEAPPSYERVVVCASCHLGFTPAGDLVVVPRRKALVLDPPRTGGRLITTTPTPAHTTIRMAGRGVLGALSFVVGVASLLLASGGDSLMVRCLQLVNGVVLAYLGLQAIDAQEVLVDRQWIETRRPRLAISRRRLATANCVAIDVEGSHVRALATDGHVHLVLAAPDPHTAERVALEVRRAIDAHRGDDGVS